MKACSVCAETKPAEAFAKQASSKDGLSYRCRACISDYNRAYTSANAAAAKARVTAWKKANPEKARALASRLDKARREQNPERERERFRAHRRANRPMYAARERQRTALKGRSFLPCSKEALRAIYERAELLTLVTGVKHHVDHIVPLKGKTVCGLHVPWNLQCLPASDNLAKSNRF